uniref:Tail completion protein n=1 Tax=Dulem virus 38 TaxID=3145756 RepID=A0AAU8B3B4_9CAUD
MSPAPRVRKKPRPPEDYARLSGRVKTPVPSVVQSTALALLQGGAQALSNAVSNAYVAPGAEVAWDECCAGHLYVRTVSVAPVFGPRAADGEACSIRYWAATFALGTLRCVEVVDDRGRGPRPFDLTADAAILHQDMADLGHFLTTGTNADSMEWQAQGPDGGCVQGEWTFTVRIGCP